MIEFYELSSKDPNGIRLRVSNLGASLVSVIAPDRDGVLEDVLVGPETAEQLEADSAFMGSTVGRFANRIAKGRYVHAGEEVQLTINDGENHLHGGQGGVHKALWRVLEQTDSEILLVLESPDGADGYPGCLQMTACYRVLDAKNFEIEYEAQTDKTTPVNLAQHCYWNLSGDPQTTVAAHEIQSSDATMALEVGEGMIPTGEVLPVAGSFLDFSEARRLDEYWDSPEAQVQIAGGYDHCLVFAGGLRDDPENVMSVYEPSSGRTLRVATNMPGVQLYSGNFLDGSEPGKGGSIGRRSGLCLETQHFPDAMNKPHFPSPMLEPGELYHHVMKVSLDVM